MNRFTIKSFTGYCAIVAKDRVYDPKDGVTVLYEAGEIVPQSRGSRAQCEVWKADLERRYAGTK